jgi:hypothetical protein
MVSLTPPTPVNLLRGELVINIIRINLGLPAILRNGSHLRMQAARTTNHILRLSESELLGAYDRLALRNLIPEACLHSKRCGASNSGYDVVDVCTASPSWGKYHHPPTCKLHRTRRNGRSSFKSSEKAGLTCCLPPFCLEMLR